jgi:hypothetical protein
MPEELSPMKCRILLPLFATSIGLFSSAAMASRSLVLFGGGGEPKNINNTIFDNTLTEMDNYLSKNKWNSSVAFNGGHSQTEAMLTMKFSDATNKTTFTPSNYNTLIKMYETQIKNGELKSGDQLMIMIDSHGAEKPAGDQGLTHQIAIGQGASTTNLNDLSGSSTVSLDSLKNLTNLAKEKGIKLAILDFSCHSGNTLPLANENTCVISSTGTKHFGYNTFSENFIKKMKSGKSLEDVFLATRKDTTDNSFPMISSDEGKAINQDFYPTITPYLYYYEKEQRLDKMTDYLLSASTNAGICQRKNQFDSLLNQLENLRAVNMLNANKSMPEIERIKALISDYKEKQDQYIDLVRNWGAPELSRKEQFAGSATYGKRTEKMTGNFTWKELVEGDFDTIIKNVSNAKMGTRDAATQAQFQASIEMHTKARDKQAEILSRYPNLKNYKQKFRSAVDEMQGTYVIANKIALEERKLYDNMYNNLRQEKKSSNACRSFML